MIELKPITVKPLMAPKYDNTHLGNINLWVDDNLATLARYWSELVKCLDVPPETQESDADMACWVRWQYDMQRGLP